MLVCLLGRLASPGALALILVGIAMSYGLYQQDISDRRDEWRACVRGNEFRDTLDTTFRGVIRAAIAPARENQSDRARAREFRLRLTEPLKPLRESRRSCGPMPQPFWSG